MINPQLPDLFARCEREMDPVDILVNNHTYGAPDTLDPAQATSVSFNELKPARLQTLADALGQQAAAKRPSVVARERLVVYCAPLPGLL